MELLLMLVVFLLELLSDPIAFYCVLLILTEKTDFPQI